MRAVDDDLPAYLQRKFRGLRMEAAALSGKRESRQPAPILTTWVRITTTERLWVSDQADGKTLSVVLRLRWMKSMRVEALLVDTGSELTWVPAHIVVVDPVSRRLVDAGAMPAAMSTSHAATRWLATT